jgi:hypothetical protein
VKTTIDLPDHLLRQAKILAVEEGRSLKDLVVEALQARLSPPASPPPVKTMDGLDDDDPFFSSLEEVRAWGNAQMPGSR